MVSGSVRATQRVTWARGPVLCFPLTPSLGRAVPTSQLCPGRDLATGCSGPLQQVQVPVCLTHQVWPSFPFQWIQNSLGGGASRSQRALCAQAGTSPSSFCLGHFSAPPDTHSEPRPWAGVGWARPCHHPCTLLSGHMSFFRKGSFMRVLTVSSPDSKVLVDGLSEPEGLGNDLAWCSPP